MSRIAGYSYKAITAAGTANYASASKLVRLVVIGTTTGTVVCYDSASGTSATGRVAGIIDAAIAGAANVDIEASLKNGLCIASMGTPDVTVVWE